MAVPSSLCPICSGPLVLGAYRILEHGEMAHLNCRAAPHSIDRWPGGTGRMLCLSCGRAFEGESSVQRICGACRSRSAARDGRR
jgi:hypothetical protein